MRMAPEDEAAAISGFARNAVSPFAVATPLPVVVSHRIAALEPPRVVVLGAGEPDLKVVLSARELLAALADVPSLHVVDCTRD